jgi:DNA adenine methylase Dam
MNYIDREIVREPSTTNSTADPFLKWAGGKRWLFRRYRHLFPQDIKRLIDPFVGGGSSFFYLQPHTAILSDLNSDLMDLYSAVRTHPRTLTRRLVHYHHAHSERFFYKARGKKPSDPLKKSAWLLYLNRTCWNGLFRVNLRGEFNIPIGTKKKVFVSIAELDAAAESLKRTTLRAPSQPSSSFWKPQSGAHSRDPLARPGTTIAANVTTRRANHLRDLSTPLSIPF